MSLEPSSELKPISQSIEPRTRSPLYDMHSYWSKKPFTVTAVYIENFTKEKDIVLDPFCGCGVTSIEALRANRKTLAVDINPLAIFVARGIAKPVNIVDMKKAFKTVKTKVQKEINALYEIKCPKCKQKAIATYFVWNGDKTAEASYECHFCKSKGKTTKIDPKDIERIEARQIPFWYPTTKLTWNTRINIHRGTTVDALFTKRNLIALSILNNAIEALREGDSREVMRFIFSSCLRLCSKSAQRRGDSGSVAQVPNLWIPENNRLEKNVWKVFEAKYRNALKGKTECNSSIGNRYKEAKNFEDIRKEKKRPFFS